MYNVNITYLILIILTVTLLSLYELILINLDNRVVIFLFIL